MSGSCRTCKWLSVYKKNKKDTFWKYRCIKNKNILDNETMKLLWDCHEKDDSFSLYVSGDRKAKSIWKDEEDKEERAFDIISSEDMLNMLNDDIFGTTITFDLFLGKWVKINSKGETIEILNGNPYEK